MRSVFVEMRDFCSDALIEIQRYVRTSRICEHTYPAKWDEHIKQSISLTAGGN